MSNNHLPPSNDPFTPLSKSSRLYGRFERNNGRQLRTDQDDEDGSTQLHNVISSTDTYFTRATYGAGMESATMKETRYSNGSLSPDK